VIWEGSSPPYIQGDPARKKVPAKTKSFFEASIGPSERLFQSVMAKKEVHSHRKKESGSRRTPESDPGEEELLTEDQIGNREFLESVYGTRLRAFAETLFKGKTYGGDGPDDVVQRVIAKVVDDKEEWKGHTEKSLRGRLYESVKNDFIDLTRKYGPKRHADLAEADTGSRGIREAERVLQGVDLESYSRFLKQRVPNDKGQHGYIDLWLAGYTVAEAAEKLGMAPNRVKKMRVQILDALRDVVTREMIRGH
jgi:DNA-directed RNA polymerase specialized sigma24 family protein